MSFLTDLIKEKASEVLAEKISIPEGIQEQVLGGVADSIIGSVKETAGKEGAAEIGVGLFIQAIFNFLITAFVLFLVVKFFNGFKKKEEEKPAPPKADPEDLVLLREIRDLLKESK